MRTAAPSKLNTLLTKGNGKLPRLVSQARELALLDEDLRAKLGPPINQHLRLANLSGDTVTVQADSPAWSAKVRYQSQEILQYLRWRHDLARLRRLKVITRPLQTEYRTPLRKASLSGDASETIRKVAAAIDNPRLRVALDRLARSSNARK